MQEVHDSFGCCEDPGLIISLSVTQEIHETPFQVFLNWLYRNQQSSFEQKDSPKARKTREKTWGVSTDHRSCSCFMVCETLSPKMFLSSSVENISSFFKQKWYVTGPYCTQFWGRQQIREQKRQHGAIKQTLHSLLYVINHFYIMLRVQIAQNTVTSSNCPSSTCEWFPPSSA